MNKSPINCIIIDDEEDAIELLESRLNYLHKNITVTQRCTRWADALHQLQNNTFDLVFLDISMPGKNGIALLKLLPALEAEIIFVTAHDNYALEAFSFSTSGYVLKPVDDVLLTQAVYKAAERIEHKKLAKQAAAAASVPVYDKMGIPNNNGIDYIAIKDILYLESTNKCTVIVARNGQYTSSHNIGKFQGLIDIHGFFQAHRSFIINLNGILRYESAGHVIMADKKEIPISRNVKNEFLKLFNIEY